LYTGGGAVVGALASDQRVVPAAVAVVSGWRRGSGAGGTGAWTGGIGASSPGGIGASSPGGAGTSPAGASGDPEPGGAEGATITAPTNVTSSSVRKSRKKNRAAFIRAAWVIDRLRRSAVASSVTNSVGVISRGNSDATSVALGGTGVCQIR
jgi:hypothetical protein